MSEQYETANITYKGLTDGKLTVTLIDEKKGKWTIWKKAYQSQEDSEPYNSLQNFKFGDTFGVSYKEADESFVNEAGKTINFKKRTIYSILPVVAQPTATMKVSKPQTYTSTPEAKSVDWDDVAVGKCQSLFLQAYIQSGKSIQDAKLQVVQARQLAELVVYGSQKGTDEPLPEAPPEIDPNSIPF